MYNLPTETKYDRYTLSEIIGTMKSKFDTDDLDLAFKMLELVKFSSDFFYEKHTPYRYKYSWLGGTPFSKFNEKIKNNIYKIFIESMTLKGYVSLRCLELMSNEYDLKYDIYGPTNYDYYNDTLLLQISDAPYEIRNININKFFTCITSKEYYKILMESLPIFVKEYNQTNNVNIILNYMDIDSLVTYVDTSDNKQVINYIYKFPPFYMYLKENFPKTDSKFWTDFFLSYKCLQVAKRHQKTINLIIQKVIEINYSDNRDLFNLLINSKSKSHMSIHFSKALKSELRLNFNLCLTCYANSCAKHRKVVKKMLGPKIYQSAKFKYLFGSKK